MLDKSVSDLYMPVFDLRTSFSDLSGSRFDLHRSKAGLD